MKMLFRIGMVCGCAALAGAQETNGTGNAAIGAAAATVMQERLAASSQRLAKLRESIAAEKIPLTRSLTAAEQAMSELRREYDAVKRQADSGTLESATLRNEIKQREAERNYLSSLINEYARNFETRLHVSELEQYRDALDLVKSTQERLFDDPTGAFNDQLCLLLMSLARLEEMSGGLTFKGRAAGEDGLVKQGKFLLFGPVAYFVSDDGDLIGVANQRVGSLIPVVETYTDPAHTAQSKQAVSEGKGSLPFDASLGNARKIEQTKETLKEHFLKGGPVMWPMLGLFCCALLVAKLKWIGLITVPMPRAKQLAAFLDAAQSKNQALCKSLAEKMRGPAGKMLRAGCEVLDQPKELIEEAMFEKMLEAKFRLNRWLPFIAVTAACAPLLGLLGTVTGIISTFKLMTVFGSGDVKVLSSGISEALITTEFGLYIAIPAVMVHAFLSRKAKGLGDRMEQIAIRFMGEIGKV
jgi:biopolymer transport protein ExbB